MFVELIAVGVGGAVGALSRYALVAGLRCAGVDAPWPIAVANVLGCLGFGICFGLAVGRWPAAAVAGVLAGFFGAFTTFSSFAADAWQLVEAKRYFSFVASVLVQNTLGIAALAFGLWLAEGWRR